MNRSSVQALPYLINDSGVLRTPKEMANKVPIVVSQLDPNYLMIGFVFLGIFFIIGLFFLKFGKGFGKSDI